MSCIIDCPKLQISNYFVKSCISTIDFPGSKLSKQSISKLSNLLIMQKFSPFERSWCLDNQIILSVIDEHIDFILKQLFYQPHILHHEINKQSFIYVSTLGRICYIGVQFESALHIWVSEELLEQKSWLFFVTGYIIDINTSSQLYYQVQSFIKSLVQLLIIFGSFLVSSIQDESLDLGPLLIVNQSQVVSILSDLSKNKIGMSKAITYCDSLQSFQQSLVFSLFLLYLISDSQSILSCITFTKDEQRQISSDPQHRKAAIGVIIQLVQSIVEIICNIVHIFAIRVRVIGISIAQPSTNWLINKNYVVFFDPSIVIFYDLVGSHLSWLDEIWTQLHKITQLTRRSRPSVQPDDSRIIFEIILSCSLLSIKNKGEA